MTIPRQSRDWWLTARIGRDKDGRRKVTDEDRAYIKQLHTQGEAVREIARIMEGICSRRLIQFILWPERLERVKARAIELKRWSIYHTTDKRREYMRTHRANIRKVHGLNIKNN